MHNQQLNLQIEESKKIESNLRVMIEKEYDGKIVGLRLNLEKDFQKEKLLMMSNFD